MKQINDLISLSEKLGFAPSILQTLFLISTILIILSTALSILEKLGITTWFSKLLLKSSNFDQEISALNLLSEFNSKNEKKSSEYPYAELANQQKEITLINNFYGSRIEDVYLLRYLFSRIERKRAYRLYKTQNLSLLIKKKPLTNGYELKHTIKKPLIYSFTSIWISVYVSTTLAFIYSLFVSYDELALYQIGILYILTIVVPFIFGWILSFLLLPYRAKLFIELEEDNVLKTDEDDVEPNNF